MRKIAATLALLLLAATCSCALAQGKEIGERAVARFHEQFNAGSYLDIYRQADAAWRDSGSEGDCAAFLGTVRAKLGAVRQASQSGWFVNATTSGTFVVLTYDTEFAHGKASEHFTFKLSGGEATLIAYNVNSPLLFRQ